MSRFESFQNLFCKGMKDIQKHMLSNLTAVKISTQNVFHLFSFRHFVLFFVWSIFLWRVNKKLRKEYSLGIVAHFALRLTSMIEIICSKTM